MKRLRIRSSEKAMRSSLKKLLESSKLKIQLRGHCKRWIQKPRNFTMQAMTRKSLEAKETRRRVSAVQHPKVLVLLHWVLNLPVPENCVINAGNNTLRNMKQSAKPKQPSAMVVGRLAITRTVAGRQETSPRSCSIQRRCISQALQNKSSMMNKETESLLAVNTCYPWSIQNHNKNYSSNLASGRTSTPLTRRLSWSFNRTTFRKLFPDVVLQPSTVVLENFDKTMVKPMGTFRCFLRWKGKVYRIQAEVMDSGDTPNVLSRETTFLVGTLKPCFIVKKVPENSHGITPDPKKIDSILKMEFPKDKETMHSFLGLINFLNWYSPRLAELCAPLRSLILKDAHYNITEEHRSAFAALKNEFRKTIVLPYFDKYKDTILQTDASKKGFGAVILQDNNPVYYASHTLTSAEKNYQNLEWECMAAVWGMEKFHYFLDGKHFTLQTDQKPLVSIFQKHMIDVSPRIQWIAIRAWQYQFEPQYISGKMISLQMPFWESHRWTLRITMWTKKS